MIIGYAEKIIKRGIFEATRDVAHYCCNALEDIVNLPHPGSAILTDP